MRSFLNYSKNRFLYGLLKFGIAFLLAYLGFSYFGCMQVHAAAITKPMYGISSISSNDSDFVSQAFLTSAGSFPTPIQSTIGSAYQFALKSISMSSYIPVSKTGISWSSDLTFTFTIQNGYFTSASCDGITGSVLPEQGVKISQNSTISSCNVLNGGQQLQVKVSTVGTLQNSVNMTSLAFGISNPYNYLYACDNRSGAMIQACSSNLIITAQSADVNFTITEDPNTAILGGIQQEQQETNDKLDDLNDNIKDTTPPNLDGLSNSAGWLKPGPVDSILNLPLTLLTNLNTNLNGTCQAKTLTLPFVNKDVTLPCMSEIYQKIGISGWINTIGIIASAFILYYYLLELYKWVDNVLTMRENSWNDVDQWGGI